MDHGGGGDQRIGQLDRLPAVPKSPQVGPCQIRHRAIDRVGGQAEKQLLDLAVLSLPRPSSDLRPRNHADAEGPLQRFQAVQGLSAAPQEPNQHIGI